MSIPAGAKQPKDFMPKVKEAVGLQAANLLQKAQLDMMATKIVLVLKALKNKEFVAHSLDSDGEYRIAGADEYWDAKLAQDAINAIAKAVTMTRDEASAARASFVYPDERIQAVIDRATQEIADILLEDVG